MLLACAAPALSAIAGDGPPARTAMGVVIHSYGIRNAADRERKAAPLNDPLAFLDHCHQLGAGGVQLGIGRRDAEYVRKLRQRLETTGMYLEGSIALPRDRDDVERFAAEVRTGKEGGATILRCAMLSGRRYETFATAEAF